MALTRKPVVGDRIGFGDLQRDGSWSTPTSARATFLRFMDTNDNIAWCKYDDGRTDCFIWRFNDHELNARAHNFGQSDK